MVSKNRFMMNITITGWFTLTNLTSTDRSTWMDIISTNKINWTNITSTDGFTWTNVASTSNITWTSKNTNNGFTWVNITNTNMFTKSFTCTNINSTKGWLARTLLPKTGLLGQMEPAPTSLLEQILLPIIGLLSWKIIVLTCSLKLTLPQ